MTQNNQITYEDITTLILAGGRGTRMGGQDKGLIPVSGKPAIEHVLGRLHPQSQIIISANRNLNRYLDYGHRVVEDSISDFPGPLAGILAGLDACDTHFLLTIPVDTPFISNDFPARMKICVERNCVQACVAEYKGQMEPMFSLLHRSLIDSLRAFLDQGQRSARDWLIQIGATPVDCNDMPDQFINLNCTEDLHKIGNL
jgi:molybdopterin-guanine dinucleotide biosynthesis protein A